jgi:hypothetical protein
MARLTISLPEDMHRALKEAAARRGRTMGELVEESLRFFGIKSDREAERLVALARERAELTEEQAVELAVAETRAERERGRS